MEEKVLIEADLARQAQNKYRSGNKLPRFAPVDGICYNCHRNIYEGISVEKAGQELVTDCPFCNHSFV